MTFYHIGSISSRDVIAGNRLIMDQAASIIGILYQNSGLKVRQA
jgi:hypothetical protein